MSGRIKRRHPTGNCCFCPTTDIPLHEIYAQDGRLGIDEPITIKDGLIPFPAYVACDACTKNLCDKYGKEYPQWHDESFS